MSALDRLRGLLGAAPAPIVAPQPLAALDRQISSLTRRIVEAPPKPVPLDIVIEAVELFVKTRRLSNSREARLVALGCSVALGSRRYRLIEDAERFPQVLKGVEGFRKYRPAFRSCYQGLLETYLGYHPDAKDSLPEGRLNWTNLRAWLNRNLSDIRESNGVDQAWVTELSANGELFSENPAASFGREVLEGHQESFIRFKKALGLKETSWLIDQLVLEQVHAAGQSGSVGLKYHLPRLLKLLESVSENNKALFNRALGFLLTYYQDQPPVSVHKGLQDFSVRHWGNPWLRRNNSGWTLVPDPVRNMVTSWLKLHCIQHFFSVLAQEGNSDPRRLKFWEKYHDTVDSVTFALGPTARWSSDADMVKARQIMDGLIIELQGGGNSSNNAFIMQFGEWVVVEFGLKGNACFFLKASDLPFPQDGSPISAPAIREHIRGDSSYRGSRDATRRTHRDIIAEGTWETIFERELRARGIAPEKRTSTVSAASTSRQYVTTSDMQQVHTRAGTASSSGPASLSSTGVPSRAGSDLRSSAASLPAKPTSGVKSTVTSLSGGQMLFGLAEEARLFTLCQRLGIPVSDLRDREGNLWVGLDVPRDDRLTSTLQKWGFRYRPGRGWWYRDFQTDDK